MISRTRFYAFSVFLLMLMAGERPLTVLATLTTASPHQPPFPLFQPQVTPAKIAVYPPRGDDHFVGGAVGNDLAVVAYMDFNCADCAKQHEVLRGLYVQSRGRISLIYRHFQAESPTHNTAHAAECMAEQRGQDGFDRFADTVFMNQRALLSLADPFPQLVQNLGADSEKFLQCMVSERYAGRVQRNAVEAAEHANAAPLLLFLNMQTAQASVFAGLHSLDYLQQVVHMMTQGPDTVVPATR